MHDWKNHHTTIVALVAGALLAISAMPASAAPTFTPPAESPGDILDYPVPAADSCEDFGLILNLTGSKAKILTFDNGVKITAGKGYLLSYTNDVTNETLTFESNGSVQRETYDSKTKVTTVEATGSNGIILFSTDVDGPSAVQYTGRVVYTVSPTGVYEIIKSSGRQLDICAALK